MRNTILLSLLLFLLVGCIKLEFDGNTFYTIKGRIVDSTNRAIPNFQVSIFNSGPGYGGSGGYAVSSVRNTDIEGNFSFAFPACNGGYFLKLQDGYYSRDSTRNPFYPFSYNDKVSIDTSHFQNYYSNLNTIKVYIR